MDELVKALRYYVSRDLVFLVSGGAVVATFLYVFAPTSIGFDKWPTLGYALAAGIAYVIGYAIQDVFSVVRLVTTAPGNPGCLMRCVYRCFTRECWRPVDVSKEGMKRLYVQQTKWERASAEGRVPDYERVVMLMQIGTSGGPCAGICAVLLLSRWWFQSSGKFDLALGVGAAGLAVILFLLGRLKRAQMTRFLTCDPPPEQPKIDDCSAML